MTPDELWNASRPHPAGFREASPAHVAEVTEGARLIDVREPSEFVGELGHAPRAELFPLGGVLQAIDGFDRDELVVCICRSGGRSGQAAAALARMGFARVINMSGGMLAWNDMRLPVER